MKGIILAAVAALVEATEPTPAAQAPAVLAQATTTTHASYEDQDLEEQMKVFH